MTSGARATLTVTLSQAATVIRSRPLRTEFTASVKLLGTIDTRSSSAASTVSPARSPDL